MQIARLPLLSQFSCSRRIPSAQFWGELTPFVMPTDSLSMFELFQAISDIGKDLEKVSSSSNTQREKLTKSAEMLAIPAKEPEENLYFQAAQVRASNCIEILSSAAFDNVHSNSPKRFHQDSNQHERL